MEQELIRFVKFHGFISACYFLTLAYLSDPSMVEAVGDSLTEHPLAYEPTQIDAWLLPFLWSAQGVLLFMGVIRGYPRIMKLLCFTSVGTFVLEFTVLWNSLDSLNFTRGIICQAMDILYSFYVLRTLEQIFAHLEKKRQEAVLINAIVCKVGGGAHLKQLSEKTRHLAVLYAIGAIQALRRLFQGWNNKSGKVGSAAEMSQSNRAIAETEIAKDLPRWE